MFFKTCLILINIIFFASAKLIPGIDNAAYGYNIFKGDPNAAINDPGISRSIYEITYNQALNADIYVVPDFMDVTRSIRCSRYSTTIHDIGMTSYSKSLSISVGVDIGIDFIASFSTSTNFQEKQSDCRNHNYTYITSISNCQIYFGQWKEYENITLTDNFRTAVSQTDFSDKNQVYKFIDQFGTHVQSQTSLGALAQRTTSVKAEDVELMWSLGIDIKASASGIFDIINGKVQSETSTEITNRQYWNQTVKQQNEFYIGAKMPSADSEEDWQKLVENDISTIRFNLGDTIDSLLTSKYFPNDEEIEFKKLTLANSYSKYCSEFLNDCNIPDVDPDLTDATVDLYRQQGKYGTMIYCDKGNSIVGTCGSGRNADCDGYYHQEMCTTGMKYQSDNYYEYYAGYGQWRQCQNGSIVSVCRSGEYADCANSNYYLQMGCDHDIPVMKTDCVQVMGWYGDQIYCPNGHVAIATCESGEDPDCRGQDGNNHYTGLYCCPIGQKDDGYPKWNKPYQKDATDLNEDNEFAIGQVDQIPFMEKNPYQPKKVIWNPKKNSTNSDGQ